ncbi:hypothetical protein D3C81_2262550 [compost metagenome]
MHVLHRVLDSDDVTAVIAVAVVNQSRQRGGLARAGAADEQHQTALLEDHVKQHRRQLEIIE